MNIDINEKENLISIKVVGDIEMITIKEFKQQMFEIVQNSDKEIEIDLEEVEYIDSSGVGVLISLLKLQKKKGKNLTLSKVSPKVLNVLKLSSLAEIFNI